MRIPNPLLEGGLTLVDTPGVGGLNAGHAAATLAFLPSADALVFVTDASAELSGPELEFLASARGAGPPVLVAVLPDRVAVNPCGAIARARSGAPPGVAPTRAATPVVRLIAKKPGVPPTTSVAKAVSTPPAERMSKPRTAVASTPRAPTVH